MAIGAKSRALGVCKLAAGEAGLTGANARQSIGVV